MTNTKLFVGNLSFKTTEAELEETFSKSGTVVSVAIPTDRETGRKRGFGFVEMETKEMADAAVKEFNGQSLDGRQIVVNESKPREAAPRRGSW
ncbi:MAG: RNA-binding protein [Cyanobacteria bacterium SZAS-4]|nr:RNA-binding protein [Cyanobacteria bacterium SZAS-4]